MQNIPPKRPVEPMTRPHMTTALRDQRLDAVVEAVCECRAETILDLG